MLKGGLLNQREFAVFTGVLIAGTAAMARNHVRRRNVQPIAVREARGALIGPRCESSTRGARARHNGV